MDADDFHFDHCPTSSRHFSTSIFSEQQHNDSIFVTKSTNEPNDMWISNLTGETESIANISLQGDMEVKKSPRNTFISNNTELKDGISVNTDMMNSVDNPITNSNVCSTNFKDGASMEKVNDGCKENLSNDCVGNVKLQSDNGSSLPNKAYEDHVFPISLENDKSSDHHSDSNGKLNAKSGVESQNGDSIFDANLKKGNLTGSVGDLKMNKPSDYSANFENVGNKSSKPEVPKRKPASGKNEKVEGDEKSDVAGKGKFWNLIQ